MTMIAQRNLKMLERSDELELARRWQQDRDFTAREKLLLSYEPLLRKIVKLTAKKAGYVPREAFDGHNDPYADLTQEARLQLAESLDKFKIGLGLGFGTYARHSIETRIYKFILDMGGHCRMGTNIDDKTVFFKFRRERIRLEKELNREVTSSDFATLAERMSVPTSAVERMVTRMTAVDISLDTGFTHGDVDDDTENHAISSQLHSSDIDPEQAAILSIDGPAIRKVLNEAIESLPYRERIVIKERLASIKDKKVPYQMLAQQLRLTKKSVHDIEMKAKDLLKAKLQEIGITELAAISR